MMAENTVKIDISFQSLLEAVASLGIAEKQKLWEFLEAELFPDEEDSPEDIGEIQAARADYEAGDYTTFDEYSLSQVYGGTITAVRKPIPEGNRSGGCAGGAPP